MTRTGDDAIAYARGRIGANSMPESGLCLQFTRTCFNVASYYGSAVDAAYGCNVPHPGDWEPAPATPVWFRSPSIYDHVAFYVGPNEVISTFNADVRSFSGLRDVEVQFSAQFVGWGEDLNEVRIMADTTPPVPPPFQGDAMIAFARLTSEATVWVGDGVTRRRIASEDELRDITYKISSGYLFGKTDVQVVQNIDWLGVPVQ